MPIFGECIFSLNTSKFQVMVDQKKYALILGGSKGLGWASAKKLAQHGWNLIIVHRDPRLHLKEFYAEIDLLKSTGVECITFNKDATKAETIAEIINNIKNYTSKIKIDLVLHSIAKGSLKTMYGKNKLKSTDFAISVHAMGYSLFEWVSTLFEEKLLSKPCKIIAFTSEGNTKAWPGYAAVSAAKGALEAVVRNIAFEFGQFEITANCIQAGLTITEAFQQIPKHEIIAENKLAHHPMKRLTTPQDVANAVYLLSLAEANWINGSILKVDGGESLL